MKTYIIGSGGVGGFLGGMLAKAGNDVTFLARGEHYASIISKGLRVESTEGTFTIENSSVSAIDDVSQMKEPELIVFTVKTYDTEEMAARLAKAKVVNKDTIVITFQNGIDNDELIAKHLKAQIFPGVVYIVSTKTAPGVISQTGGPKTFFFGNRKRNKNGKDKEKEIEKLKEIEEMMRKAGVNGTYSKNIERELWQKFIFITAYSGMTALCRSPIGKVLENPYSRDAYRKCMEEAAQVAWKMKADVPKDIVEQRMKAALAYEYDAISSLLVDVQNGRRTEIETLNGKVVKLGEKMKIPTPVNEAIYSAIKLLEK